MVNWTDVGKFKVGQPADILYVQFLNVSPVM